MKGAGNFLWTRDSVKLHILSQVNNRIYEKMSRMLLFSSVALWLSHPLEYFF